jgi:hypothetical protein
VGSSDAGANFPFANNSLRNFAGAKGHQPDKILGLLGQAGDFRDASPAIPLQ